MDGHSLEKRALFLRDMDGGDECVFPFRTIAGRKYAADFLSSALQRCFAMQRYSANFYRYL